nr:unnamed protein product [Callosobruchus chinensis]
MNPFVLHYKKRISSQNLISPSEGIKSIERMSFLSIEQKEAVAVSIESPIKITICSLYLPDGNWHIGQLNDLISNLPRPYVLLGDFNAHSPLWGSTRRDMRGRTIESLIETTDVTLLNTGQPTHFDVRSGGTSAIDLSLCSTNLAHRLTWNTLDDLSFSDHFPIIVSTDVEKLFYPSHKK